MVGHVRVAVNHGVCVWGGGGEREGFCVGGIIPRGMVPPTALGWRGHSAAARTCAFLGHLRTPGGLLLAVQQQILYMMLGLLVQQRTAVPQVQCLCQPAAAS
jgi:hypothetical protein